MRKVRDPTKIWLDGVCELIPDGDGYVAVGGGIAVWRGPEILLQTEILDLGQRTEEGVLVKAASVPWFEILKHIARDPSFLFEFTREPRKFEEFIAGAYREDNWDEVTLTPSRGDRGRDIIASKAGYCSIRVLDQTKAYKPGHLVTHNDVRAMLGVLSVELNASKGLITTTSDFEPGIFAGNEFERFMPNRLELKNGDELWNWLDKIQKEKVGTCN